MEVPPSAEAACPVDRAAAPSYYSGDITHVPDSEFEAVLGHAIPPSERDQSQPLTYTSTFEDAKDVSKWGGRINRLMGKFIDPDSMAGGIAVQSPVKLFIPSLLYTYPSPIHYAWTPMSFSFYKKKTISKVVSNLYGIYRQKYVYITIT